jgi:predicted secreted protein
MNKLHAPLALAWALARALAALGLVVWLAPARADAALPVANQLSLSVSASAEVSNDILVITFSTQREGADPAAVQAQLTQAVNLALAEARKAAQPGQVDISTGGFSVQPRYAPKGEPMKWQGVAELRAEGRDFDALTRLVGRIQTLSVANVGYRLSREARDKVQAELSAQAIARFRSQAESYAKAFGFSTVTLRAVEVHTGEAFAPPLPRFRAASADMAAAAPPLPVEAGKSGVSATVSGSVQMQ